MNKEKSRNFVIISIITATVVSLIVAFIMSKNLATDVSKTRFRLTKDYKAIKDVKFIYDRTKGKKVYIQLCAKCHRADGLGSNSFPPLVGSPMITGNQSKLIKITLYGLKGQIKREGKVYNGVMPGFKSIPHEDLAQALSFVREEFGNKASQIPTIEIIKGKIDNIEQKAPYLYQELLNSEKIAL